MFLEADVCAGEDKPAQCGHKQSSRRVVNDVHPNQTIRGIA